MKAREITLFGSRRPLLAVDEDVRTMVYRLAEQWANASVIATSTGLFGSQAEREAAAANVTMWRTAFREFLGLREKQGPTGE